MSNKELLQQNNSKYASLIELLRNKAINGGGSILLQEKTITPSTGSQSVVPDSGYDGLSKVTVNAMPTATQATPSISVSSSGLITASSTQSAGYVAGGTRSATKQLTVQAAKTVTPNTSNQTAVASGSYTTGAITVKGDANLVAGNIKSGVSIFGVNGTYEGAGGGSGDQDMLQTRVDATNSCAYLLYNYTGASVDFINNLDTSNVTNMRSMFSNCANITTVPALNTSNVTDMMEMFGYCNNLTTIPALNTSKVTDMNSMFRDCSDLTTIPQLNTSKVTTMGHMFEECESLTTIPAMDTSKVTSMLCMFYYCTSLTTIPELNTSNVKNMEGMFGYCRNLTAIPTLNTSKVIDMDSMFYYCSGLTTIPQLNASNVTTMYNTFKGCSQLKSILMTGMKASFDISASTKFAREDLVTILNNLAAGTSSKTLTMGRTNLAKLTAADKAIATNKGWTLA